MNIRTTLILITFLALGTVCHTQSNDSIKADFFNKPHKLETKEDYAKYEPQVLAAYQWLIATPLEQEQKKRKDVNSFLIQWLTGSPNVSVEITEQLVTYIDCADCLMIYMAGWANYALEKQDFTNKEKGALAGTESVIQFYQTNKKQLGKIKAIEKLLKLQKKNRLEAFISANL